MPKMNPETEIQSVRSIVYDILEKDERARDCDKWLIFKTLRAMGFKIFIDFEQMAMMPSFETITRCRRLIQNEEGQFAPSEGVIEVREQRQEVFHSINKNSWMTA